MTFAGTAYSIDFGGVANYIAFDNITFGTDVPTPPSPSPVPLPAAAPLLLAGVGALGFAARRRKSL